MAPVAEHKIVFAIAPADARGTLTLVIGIPKAAWDYMKDGKTHHFDLTGLNVPLQAILYGAKDHDAAMRLIEGRLSAEGAAYLDMRRDDFAIKPLKEGTGAPKRQAHTPTDICPPHDRPISAEEREHYLMEELRTREGALRAVNRIALANRKQPGDVFDQISRECRKGFGQ